MLRKRCDGAGSALLGHPRRRLPSGAERKSLQIVNDISSEVRQYTRFTIFDDVRVGIAEDGVAVLTGG